MKVTPFTLSLLVVGFLAAGCGPGETGLAELGQATAVPPSWDCTTSTFYLGRSFGADHYGIIAPVGQTYGPLDAAGDTVTLETRDGVVFTWSSTVLVRAVFIRADLPGTPLGDATNHVWVYADRPGGGAYAGGVYTQDRFSQRHPARYVDLCFDAPAAPSALEVTANTGSRHLTRSYGAWWGQLPAPSPVALAVGEALDVALTLDVIPQIWSHGRHWMDWDGAGGEFTIANPAGVAATITGVSQALTGDWPLSDGFLELDCGVTFPTTLAPGATLVCAWRGGFYNSIGRTFPFEWFYGSPPAPAAHVATVTTTGAVSGGVFETVLTNELSLTDDCADVTDDHAGHLGVVCGDWQPLSYAVTVGPYEECGAHAFTTTATIVSSDTATARQASVTIPVSVACE